MTTSFPDAGVGTPATSASPTARQLWTRYRSLLAAALIVLAFAVTYAAFRSGENHGALDPRSPDPQGSRATAELLAHQGVSTRVVTTTDEATTAVGPDTTLLVAVPDLLTPSQQSALHAATEQSGGRTVLLAPGSPSLGILAPGVTEAAPPSGVMALDPDCDLPVAERAGRAELGGVRYTTPAAQADACYPSAGHPTLLRLPAGNSGDTVVLGATKLLTNERLAEHGNASLTFQLLGSRPNLVWYLPSLADAAASGDDSGSPTDGTGSGNFLDLIPEGWTWALLQLFIAATFAALWRARRLGPVVAERLPVAVRAAEATEGRARLYRRANARDRAAEALRSATRDRLAPPLGLPPGRSQDPATLVFAVSARLSDPTTDPRTLLYGPPPADDAALLRLADDLDALENSILFNERVRKS